MLHPTPQLWHQVHELKSVERQRGSTTMGCLVHKVLFLCDIWYLPETLADSSAQMMLENVISDRCKTYCNKTGQIGPRAGAQGLHHRGYAVKTNGSACDQQFCNSWLGKILQFPSPEPTIMQPFISMHSQSPSRSYLSTYDCYRANSLRGSNHLKLPTPRVNK